MNFYHQFLMLLKHRHAIFLGLWKVMQKKKNCTEPEMMNSVTDIKKPTRAGDESNVVTCTKLKRGLRKECHITCGTQRRSAKRLPPWWETACERKHTETSAEDSEGNVVCRSCCEKGTKYSLMHRRAREEYCESSSSWLYSESFARAVMLCCWQLIR